MAKPAEQVEILRAFNRLYTREIGVLNKRLLDSSFSLTEARVLYELAQRKFCKAGEVRVMLGLDAGYMSRIVHGFTQRKLIRRSRSETDAREFLLSLTASGRAAFRDLDRRSRRQAGGMLSALPESSRRELLDGIERATHGLKRDVSDAQNVVIRQPQPGDIGWAIERHGRLYADEFGWDESFEGLVATLFGSFATNHDAAKERCWIAEIDGRRAGCVFLIRSKEDRKFAQLRCLLVDPNARGRGVGSILVDECIGFARTVNYKGIVLWTNDVLISARKIYQAAGFVLESVDRHRSFGHDLVGQTWRLTF
jgi:DNA-binding MarR family transcriptional regulator/N-acetylglutamate synthase-like GNAT family acetyltransferase